MSTPSPGLVPPRSPASRGKYPESSEKGSAFAGIWITSRSKDGRARTKCQPHPPAWCPLGPPPHGGSIPRHQGRGALLPGFGLHPELSLQMRLFRIILLVLLRKSLSLNDIGAFIALNEIERPGQGLFSCLLRKRGAISNLNFVSFVSLF